MSLTAECSHCGRRYKLDESLAGRRVKCRQCGQKFQVPGGEEEEEPFDDDLPAAPPRRQSAPRKPVRKKKKSAASGSKLPLIAGVSAAAVVLLAVLGFAAVKLAGNVSFSGLLPASMKPLRTHEQFAEEFVAVMNEQTDILETVTDQASAERAADKIRRLVPRYERLAQAAVELEKQEKPSPERQRELQQQFQSSFEAAGMRHMAQVTRVSAIPGAMTPITEAMQALQAPFLEIAQARTRAPLNSPTAPTWPTGTPAP